MKGRKGGGYGFEEMHNMKEGRYYSMDHRRLFAFSCPIGVIECDDAPVAVAVACETLYKEGSDC